jgi:predicted PurR-regulated permease PerM
MIVTRRILKIGILVTLMVIGLYLLWKVHRGLYPFIIAFLLAYLLNPAVCYLEARSLSRLWSIIVVYLLLFSVVIGGGSRLIPVLIRELESFGRELPAMFVNVELLFNDLDAKYQSTALPLSMRLAIDDALRSLQLESQLLVSTIVSGIIKVLSHFIGLALSPVLAFYLLHDWYNIKRELSSIVPGRWRHEFTLVVKDLDKVLSGVIRGQLTIAFVVGVLVCTGLYFLNVKFALLIGILAGLLDIVPYFGAIIGATPAVTMALMESPWLAVKVALLFLIIHSWKAQSLVQRYWGKM